MAELMLYWIWLIEIYEGIFEWKQIIYTWNFFDFFVGGFSLNRKKIIFMRIMFYWSRKFGTFSFYFYKWFYHCNLIWVQTSKDLKRSRSDVELGCELWCSILIWNLGFGECSASDWWSFWLVCLAFFIIIILTWLVFPVF